MSTWPFAAANFPFFPLKQMRKPYASSGSICALVGFHDTFYDAGSSRVFIHSCSAMHLNRCIWHKVVCFFRAFFHHDAQQWSDGKMDAMWCWISLSLDWLLLHATAIPSQLFVLRRHFERASCPAHRMIVYLPIPYAEGYTFPHLERQGGNRPS